MLAGVHQPGRRSGRLAAAAVALLAALLALLAALQYHWTGELSRAERSRLEALLATGAERFSRDFDRELTRLFFHFQPLAAPWWRTAGPPPEASPLAPDAALAARAAELLRSWRETAPFPDLVDEALLLRREAGGPISADRLDPATATFVPTPVPAGLARVPIRIPEGLAARRLFVHRDDDAPRALDHDEAHRLLVALAGRIVADDVPAVVVPLFAAAGGPDEGHHLEIAAGLALLLDRTVLTDAVFPALAESFAAGGQLAAPLAVLDRDRRLLWASEAGPPGGPPDIEVRFFGLMPPGDMWRHHGGEREDPAGSPGPLVRLRAPFVAGALGEAPGAWLLRVWHPAGSLTAAVERQRHRNLALSFGVLAVLGGTVALLASSARRARRLAEEQMQFVATVSHDLRTPLAAVRSLAQNLADGVVEQPAQVRRYGGMIDDEGARLTARVEQILGFSGALAGGLVAGPRPVAVGELVRAAVEEARPLLASEPPGDGAGRAPELEIEVPPELPAVRGDPDALRRALVNLICNAARHGGSGGWIGVTARAADGRRGTQVAIRVTDRGPGVPAGELPRIFEPFFRGDEARRRRIEGTGLGLAIVRRIVEAHGGLVSAESRPGQGAAFTLTLPAVPPAESAAEGR